MRDALIGIVTALVLIAVVLMVVSVLYEREERYEVCRFSIETQTTERNPRIEVQNEKNM